MPARSLLLLTFVLAACGGDGGDAPAADAQSKQSRATPAADAQAPVQREGILFSVRPYDESGFGLDPIALVTRGGLRNVWDVESDSVFAARYYAPGTRYAVRVAGAAAGEASVLGMVEPACQERFARADVRLTRTLPAGWEGLAADAFGSAAAKPIVRALTAQEQRELATLADSIHASHRIPSAARAAGEGERLFAVTVQGVEAPVLVGTYNVRVEDGENQHLYNQLLVAEARGGGPYRAAYVFHERDDGEVGVRSFVDAADLDGDGVPELVMRAAYNESLGYTVLKRGTDGWTEIYQGGGGGC